MSENDNNNNIIVSENYNNIIMPNSIGITESGLWNIYLNQQ